MARPVAFTGKPTTGVNPVFLANVAAAAKARGATMIRVISAKRTPATNPGVKNSNHLVGHALDAEALVRGQWVPLGTLLKDVAGDYGLRSGDVPGFYKGEPDPNHVDDGYNVGGATKTARTVPAPQQQPEAPAVAAPEVTPPTGMPLVGAQPAGNVNIPVPGSTDYTLPGTQGAWESWQQLAALPDLSPDTLRFIQMAGGQGGA